MRKRLGSGKTQGPDGRWVAGTSIPEDSLMAEDLAVIATPPKKWRHAKEAGFHYKLFFFAIFPLLKERILQNPPKTMGNSQVSWPVQSSMLTSPP